MRLEAGAFSQDSFWKDSERPDPSDDTCSMRFCGKSSLYSLIHDVRKLQFGSAGGSSARRRFSRNSSRWLRLFKGRRPTVGCLLNSQDTQRNVFGTSLRCERILMVSIDLLTCRLLVGNCVGEEAHTPTVALVNHHRNTADISVPSSRSRRPSDLPLFQTH